MLRNETRIHQSVAGLPLLNEVLSLNAQEFARVLFLCFVLLVLNEVLSLNAQESVSTNWNAPELADPQ